MLVVLLWRWLIHMPRQPAMGGYRLSWKCELCKEELHSVVMQNAAHSCESRVCVELRGRKMSASPKPPECSLLVVGLNLLKEQHLRYRRYKYVHWYVL